MKRQSPGKLSLHRETILEIAIAAAPIAPRITRVGATCPECITTYPPTVCDC